VPFVLVVGDDEVRTGQYTLKRFDTGEEIVVPESAISEAIFEGYTDVL
jgi:histidyl-tRNA synthetase